MPQIVTSTVVGIPVGEVWALLRDFAAIGDWHPALPPAEIEGGPADRVGCVRVFPLAGDHRETLVGLDDQPVTLNDQTYVEWSSRFDCDEADEDKMITQIRDACSPLA